jgi:uncharacterized Zn finger protein
MGWGRYGRFAPYVRVADRKKKAEQKIDQLKKKKQDIQPVVLAGKEIAKTFWGKAWCKHLESFSDYDNRLPRGRSYLRNGSVIDLKVFPGEIKAQVLGSSVYKVGISIVPVVSKKWGSLVKECSGQIDSLIELLLGKFSKSVMEKICHREKGLFPDPKEIKLSCSCPDWADMCKHVAAVLYGMGARLDDRPEELFLLRKVDHTELVQEVKASSLSGKADHPSELLAEEDLSTLFGIEIEGKSVNSKKKKVVEMTKAKKKKQPKKTPLKNTNARRKLG